MASIGDFATLVALDGAEADVLVVDPGSRVDEIVAWAEGGPRVLCVSMDAAGERIGYALAHGVTSWLDKSCSGEELCRAVAATARGENRSCARTRASLARATRRSVPLDPEFRWPSPRETEVARLMAKGLSAPKIAATLFLSTATVKTHQQHLYEKLRVHDRAAAVAEALRLNLIE
ncbi:MAG TPA: response regulator transcription factor [Solirubrobacteraceae bacterium]